MGGNEIGSERQDGQADGVGGPRRRPPKGCLTAFKSVLGLAAAIVAVIYRGSVLGAQTLAGVAHFLLIILAVGWIVRTLIHAWLAYFHRTEVEGVSTWALPLISGANAAFGVAWLALATLMLALRADPLVTAIATAIVCLSSFLLALANHLAAQAAGRPRASEWVRGKFRDPLEPGKSTWLGWVLIKIIDGRSPKGLLSTYVGGSLATLLVVLLLTASAAVSEGGTSQTETKQGVVAISHAVHKSPPTPATSSTAMAVGATNKTIDLLCVTVKVTTQPTTHHPQSRRVAFLCNIASKGHLTNQFLVLVPPPKH
ncbi:MAG TPA: hypothetical protein VMH33_14050 [Solirubrobacterales bacterium]|nr:hypothetical protein [Solirubrobacterales bacterium]